MKTPESLEELLNLPLPEAVNCIRLLQGKTVREAAAALKMEPHKYCRMVYGDPEPIEVDRSIMIDANCHRCERVFRRHPIKNAVFPAYVCPECVERDRVEGLQ